MASLKVPSLGDYIREQREHAHVSLRQLAKNAGVSNPYLSQIERGLKKPSAEILQQIAKGLRISAETLYVRAGILEDRGTTSDVAGAVLADTTIDDRQKRVLLDIYESFRSEHAAVPTARRRTAKRAGTASATADQQIPANRATTTKSAVRKRTPAKKIAKTSTIKEE
jgi:transcriptional regulator with XRE-family HTH domain